MSKKLRNQHTTERLKRRSRQRDRQGSMLVLVVSCAIVLIIIGILALNYYHVFQQNLVGKTASESAALQYAQDMSKLVIQLPDVDDNSNPTTVQVALVDQPPQNVTSNGCSLPVMGINSRLAIVRMSMVAAAQLGNTSMLYAAQHDYNDLVNNQIPALKSALSNPTTWKDVNGNPINAVTDAQNAFLANLRAGNRAADLVPGSFSANLGFANTAAGSSAVYTNMPTPMPISYDLAVNNNSGQYTLAGPNGTQLYKAYLPIPVTTSGLAIRSGETSASDASSPAIAGATIAVDGTPFPAISSQFVFAAIANNPSLLPNNNFQAITGGANDPIAPPSIVQVTAQVTMPDLSGKNQPATMTETATAEAGGAVQNYPSGGLCVGFPDGLPVGAGANMFYTVLSVMNWSQANDTSGGGLQAGSVAPFFGWNTNSLGHWFQDTGGPIGSTATSTSSSATSGQYVHTHVFKGRSQHDDPSIACSFAVYDWLKTLGPQVQLDALASALDFNQGTDVANISVDALLNANLVADAPEKKSWDIADLWMPQAIAQTTTTSTPPASGYVEATAFLTAVSFPNNTTGNSVMNALTHGIADDGMKDPRFILNHGQGLPPDHLGNTTKQSQDNDETAIAFGDGSHAVFAPPPAINLTQDAQGNVVSTSGAPLPQVRVFTGDLFGTNYAAAKCIGAANTVLGNALGNINSATGQVTSDLSSIGSPPQQTVPAPVYTGGSPAVPASPSTPAQPAVAPTLSNGAAIAAAQAYNAALGTFMSDLAAIGTANQGVISQNGQTPTYATAAAMASGASAILTAAQNALSIAQNLGLSASIQSALTDIEHQATGPVASGPNDINDQANMISRSLAVRNNGLYVNKVCVNIVANDKALSAQGLSEVNSDPLHFTLAGQDFFPFSSVGSQQADAIASATALYNQQQAGIVQLIQTNAPMSTNQDAADVQTKDMTAVPPAPGTSLDGTQSSLVVYKYPGSNANPLSGVNIGALFTQPAYAQAAYTPASLRMFVFSKDSTGHVWTLATQNTPYSTTDILQGQYIYQDTVGFAQQSDAQGDQTYWMVEVRDENAETSIASGTNGSASYGYFADGSGTNGNTVDSSWCTNATYIGGGPSPDLANGIQAECQHVAAEFRISCPVTPLQCQPVPLYSIDGTTNGQANNTCPSPPPCSS